MNFSKKPALSLRYLKNKDFLENPLVTASGNISKYSLLQQYEQYTGIWWYIPVTYFFLALFKNSWKSTESIACKGKIYYLRKQDPEGAYNTDLH